MIVFLCQKIKIKIRINKRRDIMADVKGRPILLLRIAGGLEKRAFQLCPITSP